MLRFASHDSGERAPTFCYVGKGLHRSKRAAVPDSLGGEPMLRRGFVTVSIMALLVVALGVSACAASPKDALIGAWRSRPVDATGNRQGSQTWEFFRDGTLTSEVVHPNGSAPGKQTGTWSLGSSEDAPVIQMELGGSTSPAFFQVDGDRLTISATKEGLAALLKAGAQASSGVFLKVGSAIESAAAAEAAKPQMTDGGYQKVTSQSEIDSIASVELGSLEPNSAGNYVLSGTIENNSSWPIRVTGISFKVGFVQGYGRLWEIPAGGQVEFTTFVNTNYGTDMGEAHVSQLQVKK
jgi:hypothetical protein